MEVKSVSDGNDSKSDVMGLRRLGDDLRLGRDRDGAADGRKQQQLRNGLLNDCATPSSKAIKRTIPHDFMVI